MKQPITIDKVTGNKHTFTAQMLQECYFFQMPNGNYNLYSSGNVLLASDLKSEEPFSFTLGPLVWSVDNSFKITPDAATGNWVTDIVGNLLPARPSDHDAEDEGSFAAAAGGHVPEDKKKASASAY